MNFQKALPEELLPKVNYIDKWKMICYDCRRGFYLAIRFELNDRGKKVIKSNWQDAICIYCKSKNINIHKDTDLGAYA